MERTGHYSRRQVIRTGVSAAATTFIAPSLLRAGQGGGDDIRCGMIGVGGRGTGVLKAVHKSPGVRVTALCDIHEGRLNQAAERVAEDQPKRFKDYRELIDFKELDAVFVETPCYLHTEMVTAVLKSGRHCYGEKPMALTVPDLNEIVRVARASGKVHQVGTQLRYASPWKPALEEIAGGTIGKPVQIHGRRLNSGDMPHDRPWFFDWKLSGDVIVEQAVHEFDLFNAAFGHIPQRAAGFGGQAVKTEPKGRNIMDHFSLTLDYGKNMVAGYNHSWIAPPGASGWRFVVYGEKGAIELNTGGVFLKADGGKKEQVSPEPAGDATQLAVDDFFRCIRENDKPIADSEAGRNAALVALMGRTAIYEGRMVTMKEMQEKA